ncbi:hypothetical protein BH24GEM1_BH24GEM1_13540 [soil metagenome]
MPTFNRNERVIVYSEVGEAERTFIESRDM